MPKIEFDLGTIIKLLPAAVPLLMSVQRIAETRGDEQKAAFEESAGHVVKAIETIADRDLVDDNLAKDFSGKVQAALESGVALFDDINAKRPKPNQPSA